METLTFLPVFPLPPNPVLLFGLLLIAGVAGGELTRRVLHLPRITGYVLIGLVLGVSGLGIVDRQLARDSQAFVDIALGLILFEIGRRLDLNWLKRDRWLAATSVAECALSFACVYFSLRIFDIEPLYAAVAAAIGVSTSPAVVMLVAQEQRAEGQVTERALNLVAINSVVAFVLVTMLLSWMHREYQAGWATVISHPVYLLTGSLLLGLAGAWAAILIGRWLRKREGPQLIMLVGLVVLAVGAAAALKLSVLLALLIFGVMVRHLDRQRDLMMVDIGKVGQMFFVVLFVVTGATLDTRELIAGGAVAIVYILARFVGKSSAVLAFSYFSGMRRGAGGMLAIALTPMSGLAIVMVHNATKVYPEFGAKLAAIVLSAVLILELVGPLAVQFALRRAGEGEEVT
ncbi:MAG: cation:proton antiporter [Betaproteobacteria bacterium]|nr:cation:proton antiporter [Betaproteobacteria bacterium]